MLTDCPTCIHYETCEQSERWDSPACINYKMMPTKNPTNADRIRAMTDEELAFELAISGCPKVYFSKDKGRVDCRAENELTEGDCVKCWIDWLKQEAQCTSE